MINIISDAKPSMASFMMTAVIAIAAVSLGYRALDDELLSVWELYPLIVGCMLLILFSGIRTFKSRYSITDAGVMVWSFYPDRDIRDSVRIKEELIMYKEGKSSMTKAEAKSALDKLRSLDDSIKENAEKRVQLISFDRINYVYVNNGARISFRRMLGYGNVNFCESIFKSPVAVFKNVHNPEGVMQEFLEVQASKEPGQSV